MAPFRWIGKSRRRIWCTVLILLAMIAAPPLWWATQLWGLPDIGEPFDVAEFRAMTIPDDRNAYVLYRQAAAVYKPLRQYVKKLVFDQFIWRNGWSETTPEVRQWAEANREALALFRQGSERPDALDSIVRSERDPIEMGWTLECLKRLAQLEATRLEEQGDMASAWVWYRAILRMIHQVGLHGTRTRRRYAREWRWHFRMWVNTWATDPRTTPAMLRQALDDVVACESFVPSESYTLKADYLATEKWLNDPNNPGHYPNATFRTLGNPNFQWGPDEIQALWDAWRFCHRETERSRRVIRLLIANWLAYHDLPRDQRPSPSLKASLCDIYPFGPEAPAKARVLSPEALDRWLATTIDAQERLGDLDWRRLRIGELADSRELVTLLGRHLYARGDSDAPTIEELVDPYLRRLPAEFPEDAGGH